MKYNLAVSLAASAALLALYGGFVTAFVRSDPFKGATSLEALIFFLQSFKVAAIVTIKPLRNANSAAVVDILGAELVVLLPSLVIGNLYFGMESAPSLMVQILLAWIAGVMTFGTPFATYKLARSMLKGEALVSILPSAVFVSELMVLLVAGADAAAQSGGGIAGLSRAFLLAGAGVAQVGAQIAGLTTLLPLMILYVSLLLYALSPGDLARVAQLRGVAGIALLATAVTLAGTYEASQLALPLTYAVLPPILLAASLVWWVTREV